jgi:hypothetical protein
MPPAPRIAMQAESCMRIFTTSWSSDSRPLKICGQGGRRPKDPELFKTFSKIDGVCRFGSPIILQTCKSSCHLTTMGQEIDGHNVYSLRNDQNW